MDAKGQQTRRPGDTSPAGKKSMPPRRAWIWVVIALILNFFLMRTLIPDADAPLTVSYTFFRDEVAKGNVRAIHSRGDVITGRFATAVTYPPPGQANVSPTRKDSTTEPPRTGTTFTTMLPTFVDSGFENFLIQHKVEIVAQPIQQGRGFLTTLIFGFGPALLMIGLYVWLFR